MCFENKYKIKSISLCSSFFLCLQGQPDLCGNLFQSCFLSSSVSMANLSSLVCPSFSSFAVLSSSLYTANQSCLARRCFSWSSVSDDLFFYFCSFLVLLLALSYSRLILSLSLLCSSVALFALSFSFLSNRCFFSASFLTMLKLL